METGSSPTWSVASPKASNGCEALGFIALGPPAEQRERKCVIVRRRNQKTQDTAVGRDGVNPGGLGAKRQHRTLWFGQEPRNSKQRWLRRGFL